MIKLSNKPSDSDYSSLWQESNFGKQNFRVTLADERWNGILAESNGVEFIRFLSVTIFVAVFEYCKAFSSYNGTVCVLLRGTTSSGAIESSSHSSGGLTVDA